MTGIKWVKRNNLTDPAGRVALKTGRLWTETSYKDKLVGTFGDIGTLSFYPAHHITMGEGGAVFTNNGKLKKIAESFRDWGRDCYCPPGKDNTCNNRFSWGPKKLGGSLPKGYDHKYTYTHTGYNLKITDMQAACGLAQLNKLNYFIKQRRANFSYLKEIMRSLEDFVLLPSATKFSHPSWFGFPITLKTNDTRISRSALIRFLENNQIGTRLLFGGNLIRQPYFKDKKYRVASNLANTEKIMMDTFWVGIHPSIDHIQLDYIANKIESYFSSKAG